MIHAVKFWLACRAARRWRSPDVRATVSGACRRAGTVEVSLSLDCCRALATLRLGGATPAEDRVALNVMAARLRAGHARRHGLPAAPHPLPVAGMGRDQ